ncbi:MFS transporter [Kitasatospora griseola]|uniref:MFS transporter n=1 Tax=Kitasatospora griseola TaxID=2064 RepID=UPI001670CA25|nr:MFS transporter [Kitasatospora griseola]GGQ88058.1 MFS transporter [Kitasatospora griseola]
MARDLTLYWWGQTASTVGSLFTAVALPVVAVVHLDASPGQISLIGAAATLPALLFGLPAGVLADRIARPRRALILLDTISALAIAVVAAGLAGDVVSIPWLIALALVSGSVSVVTEVVYFLHLNQVVEAGGLTKARARLQSGQFGAGLIGRLAAGPAIVAFGTATALAIDAVSYLLSAAVLLAMRPAAPLERIPRSGRTTFLRDALAGGRILFGNRFYRALMLLLTVPIFTGAGTGALGGIYLLHTLRVPTGVYGLVGMVAGLLGLLGSTLAGRILSPHRDARRVIVLCYAASSLCALLYPAAGGPLPLALVVAGLGIGVPALFGAVSNVALSPVLVAETSEEALGRVTATLHVYAGALGLLGALAGGLLGDRLGVRPAIWTLAGASALVMLLTVPTALRAIRAAPFRPEPPERTTAPAEESAATQ